jgi:Transposase DDE domain group 1
MNISIKSIFKKTKKILRPEFEDQKLTSYAGLILFEALFKCIDIRNKLLSCFKHLTTSPSYKHGTIILLLMIHLIIGYRRVRDACYYQDDEMVKRILGLKKLPDISTTSRIMKTCDGKCVNNVREVSRNIVLDRCHNEKLNRITLDFDGTVQSTRRYAEGTAVGYNKKRKGSRSYYPLLCTISQTEQVLDVHHRPGNVHDSNGAKEFITSCVDKVRIKMPSVIIESRLDSAFFSEEIIERLNENNIEFTASVPFARFSELKNMIEERKKWRRLNDDISFFEAGWKPKSWSSDYRFIFIRKFTKCLNKGVVQLDLFEPYNYEYEYRVIVTNKTISAKKILNFHYGRGSQEGIIGELKSHCGLDYIPFRNKSANQLYLLAGVMAHNLNRELQMRAYDKEKNTTEKRSSLWVFKELNTIRKNIIQRAGRLTRPQGKLKLTMSANEKVQGEILHFYDKLTVNA